jgi:hypothetical protein
MSTTINITETAVNVVVTEETINIEASGGQGPVGVGVPAGGTAGQILAKINSTNYNTQWINNTDLVGLTSVGVSMPAAFSVANSPLTANGTIAVTGAGTALQYINGLGNLVTFPSLTGYVTAVTGTSPIASSGGTTPAISITQATTSVSGFLSSTDWNTFNGKQNALTNPVTGTGTTNNLPKFTGGSTIGNSNISDSGSLITLNSNANITGGLGINTSSLGGINGNFVVAKSITGGTVSRNVYVLSQILSDVTNTAIYFATDASTQAAAFTLNTLTHYQAAVSSFGAGSVVTTQIGFRAASSLNSATNNYGFKGEIASGTNRWNLYMDGMAANYLAGDTGIGTASLGTATQLTIGGSKTAVSAIARSGLINTTLVASANSDNLIALDIAPTFTNGAFTSVNNIGLRLINTLNSTGADVIRASPLLQLSGSIWNSGLGAVRILGGLELTAYAQNFNPTISKLSFTVGTDGASATEQMFITSAGLLGVNGGANFNAGTGSFLNDITIAQTTAATSSVAVNSNRLILKGRSWNSAQGNASTMGYLQMINVTNNANPTTDKLSFFVGSASTTNNGNVIGNATERLAIRTDGIFSYFNLAGTEFLRLVGSTGNIIMQNGGTFTDAGFRLDVDGSVRFTGSLTLSNTTNILVNPSGNGTTSESIQFNNNRASFGFDNTLGAYVYTTAARAILFSLGGTFMGRFFGTTGNLHLQNGGTYTDIPTARLAINSTTQGFLPPRMTTTEKNAISSPATGLVVFDTTLGKLCVFATTWQTITSV